MKKARSLQEKAFLALKQAVHGVIRRHAQTGRPLAIWEDGKVVWVPAKRLMKKAS